MKARIKITLKNGVLDPQGKAIQGALSSLGFSGVEDVRGTIETLSRAAVRLFQAARGCQQLRAVPAEVSRRMLAVVQAAAESLQHGYGRLANGSPAAESDADEAIASRHVLGSYRVLALQELLAVECRDLSRPTGGVVGAPGARAGEATFWFAELYGYLNDVAQELAGAGTILKKWSQRLSGAACECSSVEVRLSATSCFASWSILRSGGARVPRATSEVVASTSV